MILDCGKSLYLRSITEDDTDNILKWRNDKEVKKYFIYQKDITREEHLDWLRNKVEKGKVIQFIIVEKENDISIGSVYLEDIDRVNKKAEYGIFIGEESFKGKGFGTIIAKRVIEYAFEDLHLHRLFLRVFDFNNRAIKSYEKAGFAKEALLHDDVFVNDNYKNIIIMGILAKVND